MNNDLEFIKEAYHVAEKSCCKKKKVGCVIVVDNKIVSSGFNCIENRTFNCAEGECNCGVDNKCLMVIHAEQNAIVNAIRNNVDLAQATLYINLSPCLPCARLIYGFGIKKVVFAEKFSVYKEIEQDLGMLFLQQLNVEIVQMKIQ